MAYPDTPVQINTAAPIKSNQPRRPKTGQCAWWRAGRSPWLSDATPPGSAARSSGSAIGRSPSQATTLHHRHRVNLLGHLPAMGGLDMKTEEGAGTCTCTCTCTCTLLSTIQIGNRKSEMHMQIGNADLGVASDGRGSNPGRLEHGLSDKRVERHTGPAERPVNVDVKPMRTLETRTGLHVHTLDWRVFGVTQRP